VLFPHTKQPLQSQRQEENTSARRGIDSIDSLRREDNDERLLSVSRRHQFSEKSTEQTPSSFFPSLQATFRSPSRVRESTRSRSRSHIIYCPEIRRRLTLHRHGHGHTHQIHLGERHIHRHVHRHGHFRFWRLSCLLLGLRGLR